MSIKQALIAIKGDLQITITFAGYRFLLHFPKSTKLKKNSVTLSDIARELHMTAATVSRALTDHPEISAKTKPIVKEAAQRLDYKANRIASSLRSGKTRVIGVLILVTHSLNYGS